MLIETVVDTLPIAVLLIDDLGKIVFTNGEAQALFFEGKKPAGQNVLQLLAAVPEGLSSRRERPAARPSERRDRGVPISECVWPPTPRRLR